MWPQHQPNQYRNQFNSHPRPAGNNFFEPQRDLPIPEQKKALFEGAMEAEKEKIIEQQKNTDKLNKLLSQSGKTLLKIRSVFPFDFFPSELSIDMNKVSCIERTFFYSERQQSITISDISDVYVDMALLFATIKIVDKFFDKNAVTVRKLKKHEALLAKGIIQGLIVANRQEIDLSKIEDVHLTEKLKQLGENK